MPNQLKDRIITYIQENSTEFQIINNTKQVFQNYIYDTQGEYLIGGKEVAQFITDFIDLYI